MEEETRNVKHREKHTGHTGSEVEVGDGFGSSETGAQSRELGGQVHGPMISSLLSQRRLGLGTGGHQEGVWAGAESRSHQLAGKVSWDLRRKVTHQGHSEE